ncbi:MULTISPECIES: trypsin-like peptidase domain-containing protein [unclassified Bosea (in: a-proteobacteria)]|uniref:trypsin-like serine peptidase n=1 Tax=unclassified Bosea (in: a-proteobacteria) TaxID=2653178 RepID=UPI000F75E020|nr:MULTISPECIES: trypsin-like peptidase domain-containing protein [unclassified Bosea (in: a-proteobacteria)]AZO79334.1 hypothetical protein BLM15_18270 [Bosea sp. Tri-49]
MPATDLLISYDRSRRAHFCVCRIDIADHGAGTGFLVGPKAVLTNHHVVSGRIAANGQLRPDHDLACLFDFNRMPQGGAGAGDRVAVIAIRVFSRTSQAELDNDSSADISDGELDYALLELAEDTGEQPSSFDQLPRGWIPLPEKAVQLQYGQMLRSVQHPQAAAADIVEQPKSFERFLSDAKTRIIYRISSAPGSSGSPVFTSQWDLVALHVYGDPHFRHPAEAAKRAVPIERIRADIVRQGAAALIPDYDMANRLKPVVKLARGIAEAKTGPGTSEQQKTLKAIRTKLKLIFAETQTIRSYKNLHDFLHRLQKQSINLLDDYIRAGNFGRAAEIAGDILLECKGLARDINRLPAVGISDKSRNSIWFAELTQALHEAEQWHQGNAPNPLTLTRLMQAVVRREMPLLTRALVDTVRTGTLSDLPGLLKKLSRAARAGSPEAALAASQTAKAIYDELLCVATQHETAQALESQIHVVDRELQADHDFVIDDIRQKWISIEEDIDLLVKDALNITDIAELIVWRKEFKINLSIGESNKIINSFRVFRRSYQSLYFRIDEEMLLQCDRTDQLGEIIQDIASHLP